jgi:hypothetical protein
MPCFHLYSFLLESSLSALSLSLSCRCPYRPSPERICSLKTRHLRSVCMVNAAHTMLIGGGHYILGCGSIVLFTFCSRMSLFKKSPELSFSPSTLFSGPGHGRTTAFGNPALGYTKTKPLRKYRKQQYSWNWNMILGYLDLLTSVCLQTLWRPSWWVSWTSWMKRIVYLSQATSTLQRPYTTSTRTTSD